MENVMRHDEERWSAVLSRDRKLDGAFVYAVRSTGVYCRPSCPSRRPRRDAVEFFAGPREAERAGFRACRRCRPGEPDALVTLVERATRIIEASGEAPPGLATLARKTGASASYLQRIFKRILGVSPRQYADALRQRRLKDELRASRNVADAVYGSGFGAGSRVYERSGALLGMTPGQYRRGGSQAEIGYTTVACPLGRLLLAATAKGVCAVSLGASDEELEAALRAEFPRAEIRREAGRLRPWAAAVAICARGTAPPPIPLDVRATAFQRRVWDALRAIPAGQTRSYQQVAAAIGKPRAARAVARACAGNPTALLVPCHRVVRQDGRPGGYRWGAGRKQSLLEAEHATNRRS